MLLALFALLQVAVGVPALSPAAPLLVRWGEKMRAVPVLTDARSGSVVRADLLAEALGAQLVTLRDGTFRFALDDRTLTMTAGTPLVSTDSGELPMIAAPTRVAGRLYVPLAMATELLPRTFGGLLFDADKQELRRFAIMPSRARTRRGSATKSASNSARMKTSPRDGFPSLPIQSTARDVPSAPAAPGLPRRRTVVVDAGHGGPDNGMTGPLDGTRKVHEKDITLAVARSLQQSLERRGLSVVMTRTTDTLIALGDRGKIANQAKGDLFISVHVNAANPHWTNPATARGFETYFLAEAKTQDEKRVEEMENQSIRFETSVQTARDDPLGFIIRDMAQNEQLRESSRLAELVQHQLKAVHPGPSRGIKQAGFSVLVHAFMPAVLVEVGFGSNSAESAYMSDAVHQKQIAEAIAGAAATYLAQYERKVGPGTP